MTSSESTTMSANSPGTRRPFFASSNSVRSVLSLLQDLSESVAQSPGVDLRARLVSVQAEGCAPVVRAFKQNEEVTVPWPNATTRAYGLRVPSPLGGFLCLRALRETKGTAVAVSEDAIARGDISDVVRSALTDLPPEQRRAVVLAAVYGRTALEISEEEAIPLGTAKTRIRTGLIRLRAAVEHLREVEEER